MTKKFHLKRSIPIKGVRYKITQIKQPRTEDGDCMGYTHTEKQKIVLERGLKDPVLKRTLIHEMVHAYLFECNVSEALTAEMEEVIAETISGMIEDHFDISWLK